MKSLEDLLAKLIVGGGLAWLRGKLQKDFDLTLDTDTVYKFHYELKHWLSKSNLTEKLDKDLFIEIIVDVLGIVEGQIDVQLVKDPDFLKKSMKKHAWLWNVYKFFSDYVTSENVKAVTDSPITKAIDRHFQKEMVSKPKLLDYKVHRDVDFAIEDYTSQVEPVKISEYNYSEKESDGSLAQELLGGEMRLTAEFYQEDNEL